MRIYRQQALPTVAILQEMHQAWDVFYFTNTATI